MSDNAKRTYAVLGFASTHAALDAEALLLDLGFDVVPIPAPTALSANCGIALRLEPSAEDRALSYLSRAGIEPTSTGRIEDF